MHLRDETVGIEQVLRKRRQHSPTGNASPTGNTIPLYCWFGWFGIDNQGHRVKRRAGGGTTDWTWRVSCANVFSFWAMFENNGNRQWKPNVPPIVFQTVLWYICRGGIMRENICNDGCGGEVLSVN